MKPTSITSILLNTKAATLCQGRAAGSGLAHLFESLRMAGLRLGYAVGHKDLIKQMSERRLAVDTNQLVTAAAAAGLNDDEFVARVCKLNAEVRNYLCGELKRCSSISYLLRRTSS